MILKIVNTKALGEVEFNIENGRILIESIFLLPNSQFELVFCCPEWGLVSLRLL